MKKARISALLIGLLLTSVYIWYHASGSNHVRAASTPLLQSESPEMMPQEIDFAYYTLRNGFNSTLRLVSDSPTPLSFVLTYYSLTGRGLNLLR